MTDAMQIEAGLTGDAAALAREHSELLARLPATIHAFVLVELQKWPTLFVPEQRYQAALLNHLARVPRTELAEATAGIARVEADAGIRRTVSGHPARLQEEAQALLRKRRLGQAWRNEVDGFFQEIDAAIEARLYPPDAPRRLVVQLYGGGIAVQPHSLWSRFTGTGVRVPLDLRGVPQSEAFLRALLGGGGVGTAPFAEARRSAGFAPLDTWIIESHEMLHGMCDGDAAAASDGRSIAGLSYDRLRGYRDDLTRALYRKIQTGVESPQAFAAYARSLQIAPSAGALLAPSDLLQAFVRDVFLTGNGTLFVNNTFVEWAAVQALRRAQPRILVTRFGVRDRLKPFSSMLLFSQPRRSDQIPDIEDPVGSFVDVEQLSYYVWLNAEKSPAYRQKTLYLFLAEGIDEMLAIRSDMPAAPVGDIPAAGLPDVHATMAAWLDVPADAPSGRPIRHLIG